MRAVRRPRPVLFWLRCLVVLGIVPGWAAATLAITGSYQRERANLEHSTVATARDVMQAVELDLAGPVAALQALATSPYLDDGDITTFREQAQKVVLTQPGNGIALIDPAGDQIMSTLRPYGEPLPRVGAEGLVRAVLATAKPGVSDFYIGNTSGQGQIAVGAPVLREGRVAYILAMGVLPQRLNSILMEQHLAPKWIISIFDRNGVIVARTSDPDQFIAQKGSPTLLQQIAEREHGCVQFASRDGAPVLVSFSRSNVTGWAAAIAIPLDDLTADLKQWLWLSSITASAIFLAALVLARRISLRIADSIRGLTEPALALASDAPIVVPPVEIVEVAEVGGALLRAKKLLGERTIARDRAEAEVLAHRTELAHFSRVSLAGEMAAGIAHELSQPLTAIVAYGRGCLRLLAGSKTDPEVLREPVREVVRQAERAGEVLIRLRDFVRDGASRARFVPVPPLIDTAVALAASDATYARVEIARRIDPNLPLVFADDIQIEQVILNLLRNAIDAIATAEAKQRRIVIAAKRHGLGQVEISVADTGPGIADDMRDSIFEPFITTKPRGMGMGLSISRTIIEAHGSELRLAPGRGGPGATFVFDLPTTATDIEPDAG